VCHIFATCFVVPSIDQANSLIWPLWYRVSFLSFSCAWNIDTERQHLPGHHMCWHAEVHPQLNCLYGCKSTAARQSGLCAELPSVKCVTSCLVSKGCGCLHQLDSWFKRVQYGLSCRRVTLLRSEVFEKYVWLISNTRTDIGKLNFVVAARRTPTLTFSSSHKNAPNSWLL
jgi:hypothetical protein